MAFKEGIRNALGKLVGKQSTGRLRHRRQDKMDFKKCFLL
jgi:hypothetical protein